jgi:hypothetical protein
MELGQIVDYVVEWNEVHSDETDGDSKKKPKETKRKATQADWDAFLG